MTPVKLTYFALNGIVAFRDAASTNIPEVTRDGVVWKNKTCLVAACQPDSEGSTAIVISDGQEAPQTNDMAFDGNLYFPSGFAVIDTVHDDVIAEFPLHPGLHRVRLWTDGHKDSELLIFGID